MVFIVIRLIIVRMGLVIINLFSYRIVWFVLLMICLIRLKVEVNLIFRILVFICIIVIGFRIDVSVSDNMFVVVVIMVNIVVILNSVVVNCGCCLIKLFSVDVRFFS